MVILDYIHKKDSFNQYTRPNSTIRKDLVPMIGYIYRYYYK